MIPAVSIPRPLARTIHRGHNWIRRGLWEKYGLPVFPPGQIVQLVEKDRGEWVALGFFNPHSQIVFRVLTRTRIRQIDADFWHDRLKTAWYRRQSFLTPETTGWRWVNSDADGLPGTIIDVYDQTAVLQILSYGMERYRSELVAAMRQFPFIQNVVEKSTGRARLQEGLEPRIEVVWGQAPDVLPFEEHGIRFYAYWKEGHKTGFYLDQRENRARLRSIAEGRSVLDVCAYTGSFALIAVLSGARKVVAVEQNRRALEWGVEQARTHGIAESIEWIHGDAFDYLRHLARQRARYDIVILDPPPLAPTRAALPNALRAYRELNRQAMRIVAEGGWLLTTTCSHHVTPETFLRVVLQAAASVPRYFRVHTWRTQPPDHPFLLHVPETRYFQALWLQRIG